MIFFDLDETILETGACTHKIYDSLKEQFNIDMDSDEFRKTLRTPLRYNMIKYVDFPYHETIGIDPIDLLLVKKPYFSEQVNRFKEGVWKDISYLFKGVSKEEFYDAVLERRDYYKESIPGMIWLLKELKKEHKLGINTNGISELQHYKVELLNIGQFFDYVFVSGDFGYGKPDPKYYQYIIDTSGCDPKKSIMIGDNIQGDIMGGLAAGMKAIYFNGKDVDYYAPTAHTAEELYEEIKRILKDEEN